MDKDRVRFVPSYSLFVLGKPAVVKILKLKPFRIGFAPGNI
jgi:hypothetical protein